MALLRSCLKAQRQRNGAAAEDLEFPPASQVIEMFAASGCVEYVTLPTLKPADQPVEFKPPLKAAELCETMT